jgi:hypothetical protein
MWSRALHRAQALLRKVTGEVPKNAHLEGKKVSFLHNRFNYGFELTYGPLF